MLAGEIYHARGTVYFEQGLVNLIDEDDDDIIARVVHAYDYQGPLGQEDDKPLLRAAVCERGISRGKKVLQTIFS